MRTDLDDATRGEALAMLSPLEVARYDATPSAGRDRFLAGRLLLRRLVAEVTGEAAASITVVAMCPDCGGPHGRPKVPGLHVSLSHGDGVVVAAASRTLVGIDIEPAEQSAERLAAIAEVAGAEVAGAEGAGGGDVTRWTRVEAILKADGRGLRVDPRTVRTDGGIGFVEDRPERYKLSEIELAPGVTISLAEAF